MSVLRRLSHSVTVTVVRPAVLRRLGTIKGLENVPCDEPFVLVSNHVSFFDHFVYGALLAGAQGRMPAFLTKAESFVGLRRHWFEEMGAVPVDRDAPARQLLTTTDGILAEGRTLVVYPEGTRARTPEMLPFKDGAARFAERAGVALVPAALTGTREVLPVGARYPRHRRVDVVIGAPLYPDPALPRGRRIADLTRRAEEAVHALLAEAKSLRPWQAGESAATIARLAEAVVERSLDPADPAGSAAVPARRDQAVRLLKLSLAADPNCLEARVGMTRLTGLRAIEGAVLLRPPRILRVWSGARRALRREPENLMARYLMARWCLATPRLLGGSRRKAVAHFAEAERLGGADSRYAMGHAEALVAAGRLEEAARALERVIAAPAADLRTQQRSERAQRQLAQVSAQAEPLRTGADTGV